MRQRAVQMRLGQRGFGHVGFLVLLVAVGTAVGLVGWRVAGKYAGAAAQHSQTAPAKSVSTCTQPDASICSFLGRRQTPQYVTVRARMVSDGAVTEATYKHASDKRLHVQISGQAPYELVLFDTATYTRAADGTWWKQPGRSEEATRYSEAFRYRLPVNPDGSAVDHANLTFKRLATEICGLRSCLKYQVMHPAASDTTEYVWFDAKDYLVRRTHRVTGDGTVADALYSYDKVTIVQPDAAQDLAPNQVLLPGAAEPTTIPEAGSLEDYRNSLPHGRP
ncbi:MAG TPA: hypothetical protein VK978_03915 [Candidatus Saccharimonadales bacterium]|nr:hypothetical protein [Candidatus Saccharimonadales bacterium]